MQKMIVKKPWGTYEVLLDEPNYKVKRIVVNPYERFSLQYHKHREEHWVVVEGDGIVQVNDIKNILPIIRTHWVISTNIQCIVRQQAQMVWFLLKLKLVIVDEEDIVRLEDDYGRLDSSEVSV